MSNGNILYDAGRITKAQNPMKRDHTLCQGPNKRESQQADLLLEPLWVRAGHRIRFCPEILGFEFLSLGCAMELWVRWLQHHAGCLTVAGRCWCTRCHLGKRRMIQHIHIKVMKLGARMLSGKRRMT